jgi:glycerophosphoryl diester phosphodiesterase
MTDGKGEVKDMTLAEIKKLDLGVRFPGQFPNLRVPTFDEVLELCKGKIGIYVDTKDAAPKDLIAAIERHDMGDHVMFWSEHTEFLKQIHDLRPKWVIMPEAFNPENVQKVVDLLHPQLLGADERDFNAPTIVAAKAVNVGIFVDRQTEQEWRDAVEQGAVGIQTNHPVELMAFLRANGYHK